VRVEGHTDNRGGAAMNMGLSTRRAASVATWLIKHGVDKSRLTSKGFGLTKPIDTNATEEGRQNNRRVEFHIEGGDEPKK
jgi:outer membrane protein OmpA-like peptidoglycan-associated protein